MTKYLRTITVNDGYNGHTVPLYLCEDSSGTIYGVHSCGWIIYADPSWNTAPLPEV